MLREKLAKAVEKQEYEQAALYRDEIKALEESAKNKDGEEKNNG
jgi:protein-arginine kinase activator protein McsA